MTHFIGRYIPVLDWLPRYQQEWLRPDLLAGLSTAAVVIPKALAYAAIAGLPVQAGLYVAFMPMLVYALLGSSRVLSVSSTTTIAMLTATALAGAGTDLAPQEMLTAAAILSVLTGGILLLAGILRLGFLANFISEPVLTGFKGGIGLVIVVDQMPKLFGVYIDHSGFFRDIVSLFRHLSEVHWLTLAVALSVLVLLLIMEHRWPRLPAPLVAVVLGVLLVSLFGLAEKGLAVIGAIPPGLPTPALPDLALVQTLWPSALGIALMAFTESVAAGRAFSHPDDPRPLANQELLALGAANIAGGFFSAFPAGGGTSQTAINKGSGARSQVSSLAVAVVAVATMLFLAPLISLLPHAVLAAVVIVTTLPLLSLGPFRAILKVRKTEFYWAVVAVIGVVLLGTLEGILVAIAISVLTLMYQANHPPLYALGRKPGTTIYRPQNQEDPPDEMLSGLLIVRTEGRMNFASAPRVSDRLWQLIHDAQPQVLLVDCSAIPDFEYTAILALQNLEKKLCDQGIVLWLAALNPEALQVIRRAPLGDRLGPDRMFLSVHEAVQCFEKQA